MTTNTAHTAAVRPLPPTSTAAPALRQFIVQKQGHYMEGVWHTRVLSVDATRHRLYLSKTGKAEKVDHRCMSRLDVVELVPPSARTRTEDTYASALNERSLCVKGLVGIKSRSLFKEWFGSSHARQQKEEADALAAQQAASQGASTPSSAVLRAPETALDGVVPITSLSPVADYSSFAPEVWMLRCLTRDDLLALADALRAALPD